MFSVSPEVFRSFESQSETQFIVKLGKVLREAVPDLAQEAAEPFNAQIRLLVEQARSYGLRSEQSIGAFCITAAMLGPDFVDQFAGARQILLSSEPEERKAELLEAFTLNLFEILGN